MQEALADNVHCLVTYNSVAACEAIMHGKPAITLGPNAAGVLCSQTLNEIENPRIPTDAIAIQLMESLNKTGDTRKQHLQKVAEECILIDGLDLNSKKWPSQNYFVDMGKVALGYRAYAQRPPELFYETIAKNMNNISKVLHRIRNEV